MRLGQYERHIQYLYEASRAGTMRAASERLNVATSSISRQIAVLEAEIGSPVVERGRRSIRLTETGELLVQYYREKLAHDEAFVSELQELRGNRTGHISLAIGEGFVSEAFTAILSKFIETHPNIHLSINISATNDVQRQVREDEAHIGMVFQPPPDPKIRAILRVEQPLRVIVHPDDPLASKSIVELEDLKDRKVSLPDRSFRIRQLIEPVELQIGSLLDPVVATNSLALLKYFVKYRQGIAILTELVIIDELNKGELVAIPIRHPDMQAAKIHLVTRMGRQLSVPARQLLKTIEANLKIMSRSGRSFVT